MTDTWSPSLLYCICISTKSPSHLNESPPSLPNTTTHERPTHIMCSITTVLISQALHFLSLLVFIWCHYYPLLRSLHKPELRFRLASESAEWSPCDSHLTEVWNYTGWQECICLGSQTFTQDPRTRWYLCSRQNAVVSSWRLRRSIITTTTTTSPVSLLTGPCRRNCPTWDLVCSKFRRPVPSSSTAYGAGSSGWEDEHAAIILLPPLIVKSVLVESYLTPWFWPPNLSLTPLTNDNE